MRTFIDPAKIVAMTNGTADMLQCRHTGAVVLAEVNQGVRSDFEMYAAAHAGARVEKNIFNYLAQLLGSDTKISFKDYTRNFGGQANVIFGRRLHIMRTDEDRSPRLVGDLPVHIGLVYDRKLMMHVLMDPALFPKILMMPKGQPVDFLACRQTLGSGDLIIKRDRGANGSGVYLLPFDESPALPAFTRHMPFLVQAKVDVARREVAGQDYSSWVRGYFTSVLYDDGSAAFVVHGLVGEVASVPVHHVDQRMAVVANQATGREKHPLHYALSAKEQEPYLDFMRDKLSGEFYRLMTQPLPKLLQDARVRAERDQNTVALSLIDDLRSKLRRINPIHHTALHGTPFLGGERGVTDNSPPKFIPNTLPLRRSTPG